ncbi:MAG: DUF255 domain-containing protein [Saprospirales bacterium]|nr:MAG: DUF255 domain-containing protein [Saprospirales bacterium]
MSCFFLVNFLLLSTTFISAQEKVNWMSFEEAIAAHERVPKKIIIDMYTDWCGWCKRMDESTFGDESIARYINENFYAVKFNAESRNDIHFRNEKYSFIQKGNRGHHEFAIKLSERLGRLSFPTIVFLDEDLNIIQPIAGFIGPEQFAPIIFYIAGGHYLQTPWKQFEKKFDGLVFK